jgi:hypothetical protein
LNELRQTSSFSTDTQQTMRKQGMPLDKNISYLFSLCAGINRQKV